MARQRDLIILYDGKIYVPYEIDQREEILRSLTQVSQWQQTTQSVDIYQITTSSLWSAVHQGWTFTSLQWFLESMSRKKIPTPLQKWVKETMDHVGKVTIEKRNGQCVLVSRLAHLPRSLDFLTLSSIDKERGVKVYQIDPDHRFDIKRSLAHHGYPVTDHYWRQTGQPLSVSLHSHVRLRPYQEESVQRYVKGNERDHQNGIIVLPCGAGKTIVAIALIAHIQEETLILTPNETSMKQWERELLAKTTLKEEDISCYSRNNKRVAPITITTYQMMTYRSQEEKQWVHLPLFQERDWGFLIYDEVHMLPAPLFRATADLQGKKRLGLTATFVREDGKERDLYALLGPKRDDQPLRNLQQQGWLANPNCYTYTVQFGYQTRRRYVEANKQERFKMASVNPKKIELLKSLLRVHEGDQVLVIGHYLEQLRYAAEQVDAPLITGQVPIVEREKYYEDFRGRKVSTLIVSKVANVAVDLPDAEVAIQLSGHYGSRQEEAQRIGRILRKKKDDHPAYFYSIVTEGTEEEMAAVKRQRFMEEQGYTYEWLGWSQ
ncbi:DNA repair helicase XPB [Texcoconibacillus texcoconensis]|uniref:DNA 3'-5' helicase n=1 Tax=Texcoconibacillus texcoconensis TaxID=1095777 RepID=A0A840QLG6_9BACI|nr:DNA excision repair protein ERCC-3 [Texcoconibacillus texcoconensis]